MLHSKLARLVVACVAAAPVAARADDLFQARVTSTDVDRVVRNVGGSSLLDLTDNLVQAQEDFFVYRGRPFVSEVRYAGINRALLFNSNANGTRVNLSIPSTGFTRTFAGPTRENVKDQIRDFIKKDGSDEYAKFLEQTNELSPVAVNDGNPGAVTAILADEAFRKFGLRPSFPDALNSSLDADGGKFRVDLRATTFDAEVAEGWSATLAPSWQKKLGERVAISLGGIFHFRDVEGSEVYVAGIEVGVPIAIIGKPEPGLTWQVTPFFTGGISASEDFVAGGIILGGGLTSLLSYPIKPDLVISMGNQISFHEGVPLNVSDYRFDTEVSQQILKNALQISYGPSWFVDASITHTYFIQDAAVETYFTPAIGAGIKIGKSVGIRLAYSADLGDDYTAHNGNLMFSFGF